ncbi:MAG: hypothetical protein J6Q54_09195 [Oscillospiraceae bacterium]|nr:hypothetical protein [Oscillospiraceae bacterium]
MRVQVDTKKCLGAYEDPTRWMNSTLRYVPPVDFPEFLEERLGKPEIMRVWITLDEYYDYRTDTTYPDFEIGTMRYPVEELHYPYDMRIIVPAPTGTRFKDYLTCHSRHAKYLLLNVRRYEREVSDGIITYDQYEELFTKAVEFCKELAPNIRYIECCNEIDIANFGLLNAQEYVKIYLRAFHAIQELNKKHNYEIPLELGGFGMAHPLENFPLMEQVMALLKESPIGEAPMAFYSYHMYNAPADRSLVRGGHPEKTGLSGLEKLHTIFRQHYDLVERLGLPNKPVFLNELGRARATGMDGDSAYNAAGLINYLIAFSCGEFGRALPFPWCTFHNPELQMSYTQYLHRKDSNTFVATPNGIAIEMLHSMQGQRLESRVSEMEWKDKDFCALAVQDGDSYAVLTTNPTVDSMPMFLELEGLKDGTYQLLIYRLSLVDNNLANKKGKGTGKLTLSEELTVQVEGGILKHMELYDKDCFSLICVKPI